MFFSSTIRAYEILFKKDQIEFKKDQFKKDQIEFKKDQIEALMRLIHGFQD